MKIMTAEGELVQMNAAGLAMLETARAEIRDHLDIHNKVTFQTSARGRFTVRNLRPRLESLAADVKAQQRAFGGRTELAGQATQHGLGLALSLPGQAALSLCKFKPATSNGAPEPDGDGVAGQPELRQPADQRPAAGRARQPQAAAEHAAGRVLGRIVSNRHPP